MRLTNILILAAMLMAIPIRAASMPTRSVVLTTNAIAQLQIGDMLIWSGSAWVPTNSSAISGSTTGTVTSVALSTTIDGLSVGAPVTTAGTLTLTGTVGLLSGGTGSTNAAGARAALELGTAAQSAATAFEPAGVSSSDITDSTAAGRALIAAADAAAQRAAMGLGSSSTNPATAFAAASHAHAGEDITSGTVAEPRIASTIARDSEVAAIAATLVGTNAHHTALSTEGTTGTGAFVRADSPSVLGNWTFESFTTPTMVVTSNLFVPLAPYGSGWLTSSNAPSRKDVADKVETLAPKDGATLTGTVTLQKNPLLSGVTPSTGNIVLDFQWPVLTHPVTNNIVLTMSTNRPASSTNVLFTSMRLIGDTVDRTFSWPVAWTRLGTNITTIPSNKVVWVSAASIGPNESGVTIGIAKQE